MIEQFEPWPGGAFRMTLVFDTPGETSTRKTSRDTDSIDGRFVDLIANERVRQMFEFRSDDPAFAGAMTMTWTLTPMGDATEVAISAENVPIGIQPRDHETGMNSSLANLADFVE